jgi:hypothetical protein
MGREETCRSYFNSTDSSAGASLKERRTIKCRPICSETVRQIHRYRYFNRFSDRVKYRYYNTCVFTGSGTDDVELYKSAVPISVCLPIRRSAY